eukprot:TRINITY_DN4207_c0_g1_i3.p1 TRINITY_DN4207_c0_g1~~TRINITY_DN4207_c0_g1_i3.p1  ORF type:complete len:207 (+),score=59.29 TRINITY_DN4207_c0_g1_i3:74-694(+)
MVEVYSVIHLLFYSCLSVTLALYASCGLILSLYFGTSVKDSCNLNWKHYTAGYSADGKPFWVGAIEYIVVLFPAIDVLSAFPLCAIALGNNLLAGFSSTKQIHECSRWRVSFFRLIASIPPVLLAFRIKDLGKILDYGGLGSWLTFGMPCIVFFIAYKWSVRVFGIAGKSGPYSNALTKPWIAIGLFVIIAVTAIVCLLAMLLGWG